MEEKFIAQLSRNLEELLQTAVVPGLSIAVIQNNEIEWQAAFGLANGETGEAVTETTVFQTASLSKPVFAYAVLQSVEKGLLDLDYPLLQYLPPDYQPEQEAEIAAEPTLQRLTTRHVLSHQTGFPNWRGEADLLRNFFEPGSRFGYSGAAFHFLQDVICHLSGQDAEAWIQESVLRPFNMPHASFIAAQADGRHFALGHDKTGQVTEFYEIEEMGAAYSLHSTAVDFARFICACLRPSPTGSASLKPETWQMMLTPQIQVNDSTSYQENWPDPDAVEDPRVSWGLGWGLQETADGRAFWHWGDNGTYKAFAIGYPDQGSGMVMLSNGQNGDRLWRPLLNDLFGPEQPCLDWLERAYG